VSDATTHLGDGTMGLIEAEPARPVGGEERASRSDRARDAAYRSRFLIAYAALALVAAVGVGALVVSILRSPAKAPATPAASEFTPSQAGEIGAIQLAEAVQRKYRLPNGDEFVGVVASRNTLQDGNLGLIQVTYQYVQPFDSSKDKDSKVIRPQDAIQYSLCGVNPGCAIPGKPSQARFALLRRQGLELALRTFQNDPGVDNVAVFLRPVVASSAWEGYTLVFDRTELNHNEPGLISRPLSETLPGTKPTVTASDLTPAQVEHITALTRPYLYLYRYQLLGGRDALMQLQPAKS